MNELLKEDLKWCLTRMPKEVREILKENPEKVFVSGGFVRSCIANEKINDIDIFAESKEKSELIARRILKKPTDLIETDNAFTVLGYRETLQFIHRWFFASPTACIDSFDFTIARAAIWSDGKEWQSACDQRFYPDLAAKRLVYCSPQRIEEVGGSMLRVLKFYQRGYRIPLDSLGAVIARLTTGVENINRYAGDEDGLSKVISGLLFEVDPMIDPNHLAH